MDSDGYFIATAMSEQPPVASAPSSEVVPSTAADGTVNLGQLAGQQRAVYYALLEKDLALQGKGSLMAQMYLGAIIVKQQVGNPDRFPLAAHGLRELMEKIPRYLDVPVAQGGGMTDRVTTVSAKWRATSKHKEGTNNYSKKLREFIVVVEEFVSWFERQHSSRRERAGHLLDRLDQRKVKLPGPIKDAHASEWNSCHKFFEEVSHHGCQPTRDEFNAYVDIFERFLLDRFKPRTFEDQSVLKAIIEEGERNA